MKYENQCDTVHFEPRKILEIEKYGLTMDTHSLDLEKGVPGKKYMKYGGRTAELVAFIAEIFWENDRRFYDKRFSSLCRVGLVYQENHFLDYNLPDKVMKLIKKRETPFDKFEEPSFDFWGNKIDHAEIVAYLLTEVIPKEEGIALVEKLNGGFKKARELFAAKINEKAEAEAKAKREEREEFDKKTKAFYKNMKDL